MTDNVKVLFSLLRAGLYGKPVTLEKNPTANEWETLFDMASYQGVWAVASEGLSFLPQDCLPETEQLLQWIGTSFLQKHHYTLQRNLVDELCTVWKGAGIEVVELKGDSIGQLYYAPDTRYSCDFDCMLTDYEKGNQVIEQYGVEVNRDFYKNSSFLWKNLYVENHQFCTPVRGNKEMKQLERVLRKLLSERTEEAWANFNALFLMEHAWAHFFENALSLKHLCDWAVLRGKKGNMVDWNAFQQYAREVGFWSFATSMNHLADMLDGIMALEDLTQEDRRLLDDMLAENKHVSMNEGWKTRLQLLKNYFSQSWKYKLFSNHSAMYSLLRTVNGFVFDRYPII